MKRVLFISYSFPPHGGSGVHRPAKFVKYLPEFGWEPIVITTSADASEIRDDSFGDMCVKTFRFPAPAIGRLMRRNRRLAVLLNVLAFPDAARQWARSVQSCIAGIVNGIRPDAIWTTAPPYSAHLIGQYVKRKFGIPWFADMREQWAGDITKPMPPGYRAAHRWLERRTLADADRICCLSEPRTREIQERVGGDLSRYVTITNGWDDDVIAHPPHKHDKFTILYTGVFTPRRRPDTFIKAIEYLVASGRLAPDAFRVVFVGPRLRRYVPERPYFECPGYVPHAALGFYRREADVLLLLLDLSPENAGRYSGKLFEYIAANRPILAVGPRGGVAEKLLKQTRTGYLRNGVKETHQEIWELYRERKHGIVPPRPDWHEINRYHRRNLTCHLARELGAICE